MVKLVNTSDLKSDASASRFKSECPHQTFKDWKMLDGLYKPISKLYETNYSYRKPEEADKYLYRYEACINSEDAHYDQVHLIEFSVIRQTPKCYVICFFGKDKFVLKEARKRFAYPNKVDALNSFKIRCNWRMRYAKRDIDRAERVLNLVKVIENGN